MGIMEVDFEFVVGEMMEAAEAVVVGAAAVDAVAAPVDPPLPTALARNCSRWRASPFCHKSAVAA